MSNYLKSIVSYPARSLAEYLLQRFLGKFVGKIDLKKEGTQFNKDTLNLPDLNLNCRVLNEQMEQTPLKFVKFHIGNLTLRLVNIRSGQVQIMIKDVKIDFELQTESFGQAQNNGSGNPMSQKNTKKTGKNASANKRRELFLVDMLVSNVLTNLELSIENVAVRVVTREAKFMEEKVPTFLIRTHAISFSRHSNAVVVGNDVNEEENKIDPLMPMSDLQCLFGNKKFAISDISIHLMKEKWLDPLEYQKPGQFNTHFNAFSFPFDYPSLNHPSTILVIKAPLGVRELNQETVQKAVVRMKENYEFLPCISAQFSQSGPGYLSCEIEVPMIEAQFTICQLGIIKEFVTNLESKNIQKTQSRGEANSFEENKAEDTDPDELDQVDKIKEDFAINVLQQNPDLMASMHEMFESQHQQYMTQSFADDSNLSAIHGDAQNFGKQHQKMTDSYFERPPLIGKGDGYSHESALQDSVDPSMINEGVTSSFMLDSQSDVHQTAALPVKQPINNVKVGFRLGEVLLSVLGSQDLSPTENQTANSGAQNNREAEDGLGEVIEQLIDEQGARNRVGEAAHDVGTAEASPFAREHDRIFKAFGDQVNRDYPMQKFHLPARVKQDESQIKSSWFEFVVTEIAMKTEIKRERDALKEMTIQAGIKGVKGQRVDTILCTQNQRPKAENAYLGNQGSSSMMDLTLISDNSDKFHSCYTNNEESAIYHDCSQFGMGTIASEQNSDDIQTQTEPNRAKNIRNVFIFGQLTNVVNQLTQMGEYNFSKNTLFEIVKLKKAPQRCVELKIVKSLSNGETSQKTDLRLGKIFLSIGPSEILPALCLLPAPKLNNAPRQQPQRQKAQKNLKLDTGLQIDGLELDFNFAASGQQAFNMMDAMTSNKSSVQEVLAQSPCANSTTNAKSFGLNAMHLSVVFVSGKQPCFKVYQAELVAKIPKQEAPIALCTLHKMLVRLGAPPSQIDTNRKEHLSYISEESKSSSFSSGSASCLGQRTSLQSFQSEHQDVQFRRQSSSYDEQKDEEEQKSAIRGSIHFNPNMVHRIDGIIENQLVIHFQQFAVGLDQADLLGPIAGFVVTMEAQMKNLINVIDAANVVATSKLQEPELFFIQKRSRIGKPLSVVVLADDITVQVVCKGREAAKVRLDKTSVDFKMQCKGLVTNLNLRAKVQDLLIIDQTQKINPLYVEQNEKRQRMVNQQSQEYEQPNRYLTLAEELEHANEFLLLHPSQEQHQRPMAICDLKISFLNQASMEERIPLDRLKTQIEILQSQRMTWQTACRQLQINFAAMKKNPVQVVCSPQLSHIVLSLSNSNLALSQMLSKLAKKTGKLLNRLRIKEGLADSEDTKLVPISKPNLDNSFESSRISFQMRDATLIYTPVLSQAKMESVFGDNQSINFDFAQVIPVAEEQLFRMNSHVALHLNHLKLALTPQEKFFDLQVRSIALHYLTDKFEDQFTNWRLQGRKVSKQSRLQQEDPESNIGKCSTSQQELQRRGFVPLLALTEFQLMFKSMQMSVKLNQVSLSFAEDSLQDFISFLRLVQISISDDLVRLEDEIEQNVNLDNSANTLAAAVAQDGENSQSSIVDPSQLTMIREQSMAQEESFLIRQQSYISHRSIGPDSDDSVMFGQEHPFRQMKDDNDMFTVSACLSPQKAIRNNPFIKKVNTEKPADSQAKIDKQRFRKIHMLSEQMRRMVCSLSFSFELGSLRLTLFQGNDFNFKSAEETRADLASTKKSVSFRGHQNSNRIMQSSLVAQSLADDQNSRLTRQSTNQLAGSKARQNSSITLSQFNRGIRIDDRHSSKEVMLLEDNYMDENDLSQDSIEEYSRPRHQHRKHNMFAKIEIADLIVTRRHFPDQILLEARKLSSIETPARGRKFKTFALSARDFQINFSNAKGSKQLLENPYSYRYHNMIELTVQSEKSYEKNIEEHSILLFLKPTKVTVNRDVIDFTDKMLKSTLAVSMEKLKVQQSAAAARDEFQVIEEEEVKEAHSPLGLSPTTSLREQSSGEHSNKTWQLIRNLVIKETSLTLSVSLTKLISFQNLTIPIKEFRLHKSELSQFLVSDQAPGLPIQKVQDCVVKFYKEDIINNQKLAILHSFRPVKHLSYFGGNVLSPIYKPLLSTYKFGLNGFLVGLSEGFGDLYTMLSDGTYDWGVYFVQIRRL